jgi:hypothetical protein
MKSHSMIVDDFFTDPRSARVSINGQDMRDEVYKDGVTYPNIARLPRHILKEAEENLKSLFGPTVQLVLSFARYSFKHTKPPHWAHSDRDIAQFLALIYMNEDQEAEKFGTCTLKHISHGFDSHPQNEMQKEILLREANARQMWEKTFTCPGKYNRAFILNAELIHAALGEYGSSKDDGRLVISIFFNLELPNEIQIEDTHDRSF